MHAQALEPMSSGRFRETILAEHEALRGLLTRTIDLADEQAAATTFEALRASVRHLYATLAEHMSFEERMLPVALRDVIGWGQTLEAMIAEDHGRQRAELAVAIASLEADEMSWDRLVRDIRLFADTLLRDMEREEEGLLDADLDAVATDAQGG
jgi:hypothetical protein